MFCKNFRVGIVYSVIEYPMFEISLFTFSVYEYAYKNCGQRMIESNYLELNELFSIIKSCLELKRDRKCGYTYVFLK